MNGVLCIDKPVGHTSFDVIARMRGILKTKKLGHAGTLDPMATGVLPVFVGRATKACDILPNHDKRYTATFRLGLTTDTQDITGEVLTEHPVDCSPQQVLEICAKFVGEQLQIPPMYSAVKVGGKRLYDLARQGVEVQRQARPITIRHLRVLRVQGDELVMDVLCSKGTYLRTLGHDIGQRLGCGATMTALRRTEAAGYTLGDCVTLEELTALAEQGRVEEHLRSTASIFEALPKLTLSQGAARLYRNGVKLDCERLPVQGGSDVAVHGPDGQFLGISYRDAETAELRLRKLFATLGNED